MIKLSDIQQKLESNGKYWIAFVGDSITSCEWVHPNWREIVQYVLNDKLGLDWGFRCFNFGYDGSTSKDILEKVDHINSIKSDLVIILTGANDPFYGVSVADFTVNLKQIIKSFKDNNSRVVLSTDTCPDNEKARMSCIEYVNAMKNINDKFVNLFELSKNFPTERIYTFKSEIDIPEENVKKGDIDFWHPNQLGNAYIAKVILKEIFDVDFDPEIYINDTKNGEKLPRY